VILLTQWVSPFRYRRIKACCQLPGAFRRLPRLSSPLTAKASTVYAWSLDHITPSRLRATPIPPQEYWDCQTTHSSLPQRHISVWFQTKTLVTRLHFQRTRYRPQRRTVSKSFVCATHPLICQNWWSQSGSNRRPPACKAGALPAELWPRNTGSASLEWWV
jgi:hypothetical protein